MNSFIFFIFNFYVSQTLELSRINPHNQSPERNDVHPCPLEEVPPEAAEANPFALSLHILHDCKNLIPSDAYLRFSLRIAYRVVTTIGVYPLDAVQYVLPVVALVQHDVASDELTVYRPEKNAVAMVNKERSHAATRYYQAHFATFILYYVANRSDQLFCVNCFHLDFDSLPSSFPAK
jgi:hypothetical protein